MEEEKKNKKQLVPIIVVVTVVGIMLIGATYAYLAVSTTSSGTSSVGVTTPDTGTVTLSGNNASLSMNLSASDMVQGNSNVTYYATPTGKSTDESKKETVLGTATVSPSTDRGYYHCTYTLEVTHTGTNDMYDLFNHKTGNSYDYTNRSEGQIALIINGVEYDFYNEWPEEVEGSFDITNPNHVDITVGMKYINSSTIDQRYLKNSDITVNIGVKANTFHCDLTEEPAAPQEIVTYWTYEEGLEYVDSSTATNKVLDYRDLNKNYFIKETIGPVVAEEDLYKYQEYYNGELEYEDDGPYTLTECQEWEYENDSENYGRCVKIVEANETYTKKEYEVCSNYGNTLICMKNTAWANSETLRTRFEEEAGLTCAYYDSDSEYVGNTKPVYGGLWCSEENPTNTSTGEFYCVLNSDGFESCAVDSGGYCKVKDSDAVCKG